MRNRNSIFTWILINLDFYDEDLISNFGHAVDPISLV